MKTIYFAHPVWTYDSPTETAIVRDLEAAGWTVVNPNAPEHAAAYAERGMGYFTDLVAGCDALCFLSENNELSWNRPYHSKTVGAGVAKEMLEAAVHGKRIYALALRDYDSKWSLHRFHRAPDTILTIEQTRARRAEMLARWAA